MQTTILGRTNLTVSRMGLGAGGHSRLGRNIGLTDAQSADLIRRALDHGVNFVDTAEGYGTESIVGQALRGRDRTSVVLSTKKSTRHEQVTPDALRASLDESLKRLGTDYIDLYNLHGVVLQDYRYLVNDIYPALQKAQQQGKNTLRRPQRDVQRRLRTHHASAGPCRRPLGCPDGRLQSAQPDRPRQRLRASHRAKRRHPNHVRR